MSCYILSFLHSSHHVSIHGLEGGVVGAVCQVQDAGHLDGGVGLHLFKQALQVDTFGFPEVDLCHWSWSLAICDFLRTVFAQNFINLQSMKPFNVQYDQT